jgi:hypothetical protein
MAQSPSNNGHQERPSEAEASIGVGRRDITPPFGIYGPVWGSSTHDGSSRGTHKPLLATALSIRPEGHSHPYLIVAVDLATTGDLSGMEDLWLRRSIADALELPLGHLMLASSHTHGSPWAYRSRSGFAGGEHIEPYLDALRNAIIEAGREAMATAEASVLTVRGGRCDLATNRNLLDPDDPTRYLTGYNPAHQHLADDTLMVGRVVRRRDGVTSALIVNYACHPTTLGGENRSVSPDYIGRMREVLEGHPLGAPVLFLQGASGDLAPAVQYVADPAVADRYGERLGYAALSTLLGMEAPGTALTYVGPIESGAPLAYWEPRSYSVPRDAQAFVEQVGLPAKPWPTVAELDALLEAEADPRMRERLFRKRTIARFASGQGEIPTEVFAWRFGNVMLCAISCEIDVAWQQALRAAFPNHAVLAATDTNYSAIGYVVREELCSLNLYQAWQPPYAAGSFTELLNHSLRMLRETLQGGAA